MLPECINLHVQVVLIVHLDLHQLRLIVQVVSSIARGMNITFETPFLLQIWVRKLFVVVDRCLFMRSLLLSSLRVIASGF